MQQLQVRRTDLPTCRLIDVPDTPPLKPGQVLAKIDRFAFTANNITYGAAGDMIGYWQFFPPAPAAGEPDAEGWGILPVWGFADIVASEHEDVPVGDRLYGYFPTGHQLVLEPSKVDGLRIVDGSAHRSQLPPAYNSYQRVLNEPGYDRSFDDERMLLSPLYFTGFFLWDFLKDNDWFGAKQVVLISASSKTSIGLAYALHGDEDAPPVIGLTSPRNLDLVRSVGIYEHALPYPRVGELDASQPTVIVDMAGNGQLNASLHQQLGDNLTRCVNVGLTHWDEAAPAPGINVERSGFFFAPDQIVKRMKDWGPEQFAQKTMGFVQEKAVESRGWLKLRELDGLSGLQEVYSQVCAGELDADQGLIVRL